MPKQAVDVELYYDGGWVSIADLDHVFADSPIKIQRGQSSEAANVRPANIDLSLNNASDRYRISNPTSPLYGKAGRNTPMRISVNGNVRGIVEASSWTCDETRDFRATPRRGKSWTDVQGGGLLQRINQWTELPKSTFTKYNSEEIPSCVGYWPCEDRVGSRTLYTPTPGAETLQIRGLEFESQTRFAGSNPTVVMPNNPNTLIRGKFVPGAIDSTDGWQLGFSINFGDVGNTGDFYTVLEWLTVDNIFYTLNWVDGEDLRLLAFAPDNSTVIDITITNADNLSDWNKWQHFIITSSHAAGTTTISMYWMTEDSDLFAGAYTDTFVGNTSSLDTFTVISGGAPNTVSFGHIIGTAGTDDSLLFLPRVVASKGNIGETTAERLERILLDRNISLTTLGDTAFCETMGPQPAVNFLGQFKEILATEDGLLFDARDSLSLVFLTKNYRYNQTPVLNLYPTDLTKLPREVADDLDSHNIVTVSQRDGGEHTSYDTTGPLGSQDPPDGIGEYRQSIDVNVEEEQVLPQMSNWYLKRGTVNLPRYPKVIVDLGANPSIIEDAEAVDVGNVITLTNFRENVIRLVVIGIVEVIGTHSRYLEFTCFPNQQFDLGVWDDGVTQWGSATHYLKTAVNNAATSLTFRSPSSKIVWGTNYPYDVVIAGERVTVTNITSASLVGGEYDQVATVIRGVNGIFKALSANSSIVIANGGRWGL